jgi:hypothetical protein
VSSILSDAAAVAPVCAVPAFFAEGVIQPFGELTERSGRFPKVIIFLFEPLDRLHARGQRIDLLVVSHGPPCTQRFGPEQKRGRRQ